MKHIFRVLSIPSDPFQELNLNTFINKCFFEDADADGSGSVDFGEFVEMMIKVRLCVELQDRKNYGCKQHEQLKSANILFQREAEKETPEDLKQAFRVFDKVSLTLISFYFHGEML